MYFSYIILLAVIVAVAEAYKVIKYDDARQLFFLIKILFVIKIISCLPF